MSGPLDDPEPLDPIVARELRRDAAAEWIRAKSTSAGRQCPVCQSSIWTVTDVQEVRPYEAEVSGVGLVIPVFFLICDNCGFCRMFNAMKAGVIAPDR